MLLSGVQTLRGIAAFMVVLHHLGVTLSKQGNESTIFFENLFMSGYRGVDLFFVISGFIMMHVFLSKRGKTRRRFLFDRILRIFTPYLPIFIALTLAYLIAPSVAPTGTEVDLRYMVNNLFLLPRADITTYSPVVAWTLTYELIFYAVFGLLVINGNRFGHITIASWMIICFLGLYFDMSNRVGNSIIFSPMNLNFGFGMVARMIFGTPMHSKHRRLMLLMGIAIFVTCLAFTGDKRQEYALLELGLGLSSSLLCLGMAQLKLPFATKLGDMSYSLYLVHYPVMAALFIFGNATGVMNKMSLLPFSIVVLVTVLLGSLIYYEIIERRFHDVIKKHTAGWFRKQDASMP